MPRRIRLFVKQVKRVQAIPVREIIPAVTPNGVSIIHIYEARVIPKGCDICPYLNTRAFSNGSRYWKGLPRPHRELQTSITSFYPFNRDSNLNSTVVICIISKPYPAKTKRSSNPQTLSRIKVRGRNQRIHVLSAYRRIRAIPTNAVRN